MIERDDFVKCIGGGGVDPDIATCFLGGTIKHGHEKAETSK